eukprot:jgi/Bigna1/90681/estExt_fgenesh1_pg.C_760077
MSLPDRTRRCSVIGRGRNARALWNPNLWNKYWNCLCRRIFSHSISHKYSRKSVLRELTMWKRKLGNQSKTRSRNGKAGLTLLCLCSSNEALFVLLHCFYVQVEQRRAPELKGKPTCVVQYNNWKGGAMIAVSYEARAYGITRAMRGEEAKKRCPDVNLIQVPTANGKSDMQLYRDAGAEVIRAIEDHVDRIERASIDESYVDVTSQAHDRLGKVKDNSELLQGLEDSFIVGSDHVPAGNRERQLEAEKDKREAEKRGIRTDPELLKSEGAATDNSKEKVKNLQDFLHGEEDRLLAAGALVVKELRDRVLAETQFTVSAGIGHNKMMAKGLGKKFGDHVCDTLKIDSMGELSAINLSLLRAKFGSERGTWLSRISRGIDDAEVKGRCLAKSIGCSKTFFNRPLKSLQDGHKWVESLCNESIPCYFLLPFSRSFQKSKNTPPTKGPSNMSLVDKWNAKLDRRRSKSCPFRKGLLRVKQDAKATLTKVLNEIFDVLYVSNEGVGSQRQLPSHPCPWISRWQPPPTLNSSSGQQDERRRKPKRPFFFAPKAKSNPRTIAEGRGEGKDEKKKDTSSSQLRRRRRRREYMQNIDPNVLAELPEDIRRDIQSKTAALATYLRKQGKQHSNHDQHLKYEVRWLTEPRFKRCGHSNANKIQKF